MLSRSNSITDVTEVANSEIVFTCGVHKAVIKAIPFRIDFYQNDKLTVSVNAKGLMRLEHIRNKPQA